MRKLLIIPFLFVCLILQANTYYVATDGVNGAYPTRGTLANPWLTMEYAIHAIAAGDTVFFRGGTYSMTNHPDIYPPTHGKDGTAVNPICFFNYPNEIPIFDWNNLGSKYTGLNIGIEMTGVDYWIFKGLIFTRVFQIVANYQAYAIFMSGCSNLTFENCVSHHHEGMAFHISDSSPMYFTNCDAYNCADSLDTSDPGNQATGFHLIHTGITTDAVYFTGCRAWFCSDDGFSAHYEGPQYYNRCWSFANGYLTHGGGSGFKPGPVDLDVPLSYTITNSISAYNYNTSNPSQAGGGFYENSDGRGRPNIFVYNNIAYKNAVGFTGGTYVSFLENQNIYRDNISYSNDYPPALPYYFGTGYIHSYNSWDHSPSVTVSDADFGDLPANKTECIAVLGAARGADGSLPDIGLYFHLTAGSDLINAGTDVGLVYDGAGNVWNNPTPSLGAFEIPPVGPTLVTSITVQGAGGATTITVEDGTLQMHSDVEPDNATDTTKTWSIIDGTGHGFISETGLVTAATNGIVTVRATANDDSGIYGEEEITISNQNPNAGLPTVYTSNPTIWNAISIYLADNEITDDGGGTISDKGVCWSTTGPPTIADNVIHCGTGTASFSATITGLKGNTTYHFRAFATNEEGTAYGGVDNSLITRPFSVFTSGGKRIRLNGKFVMISR